MRAKTRAEPAAAAEKPEKPKRKRKIKKRSARTRRRMTLEKAETEGTLTLIRGWCMDGATNKDIAGMLGISEATFYRWVEKSELLAEAILDTKEIADYKVENALFKAALAGNVTAMAIWLNNRRPDKWRQHQREYQGDESGTGIIEIPAVFEELPEANPGDDDE